MAWDDVLQRDVGGDYYKNNAGWQAYSAGQAGKKVGQQVVAQAAPKPATPKPVLGNAMSAPAANYSAPQVAAAANPYAGLAFKAAANRYTPDNAALQARQAQESAANAQARTNVAEQMRRSWGSRGTGMNSGLAMNQEAAMRMGFGTQLAGRMQQNIIDNYDKAAAWDQNQAAAENNFNLARAGGMASYGLTSRDQDIRLNEMGYQRGRDAQFDPLKIRGMALDNESREITNTYERAANPIRLDQLGATLEGTRVDNDSRRLAYGEQQATSAGRVGATQAQNELTTEAARTNIRNIQDARAFYEKNKHMLDRMQQKQVEDAFAMGALDDGLNVITGGGWRLLSSPQGQAAIGNVAKVAGMGGIPGTAMGGGGAATRFSGYGGAMA